MAGLDVVGGEGGGEGESNMNSFDLYLGFFASAFGTGEGCSPPTMKCQASLKNIHLFTLLLTVVVMKQLNIGFLVDAKRPLVRFWLGSRGGGCFRQG